MKLLTSRLSIIIKSQKVLQGPNYARLSGESTIEPITVLNSVMEDAREHKKLLWIITQDMAKAFNSVGMLPLRMAMQRIKLPMAFIDLIINTFNGKKISIITDYGLTEAFQAGNGIDQGEMISPLLWRIFYDLLLYRI